MVLIVRVFLGLFFFIPFTKIIAQNIVPNPNFELFLKSPSRDGNFSAIAEWKSASGIDALDFRYGTPDFFHRDGIESAKIPNTKMGIVLPQNGGGVVGIVAYNGNISNFREYFYVKLSDAMQPGREYEISISISNGLSKQYGKYSSNGLGIHFSNAPLSQAGHEVLLVSPHLEFKDPICSSSWSTHTFTFVPDQAYTFLTIGNFKSDDQLKLENCYPTNDGLYAYYFFDEIVINSPITFSSAPIITAIDDLYSSSGEEIKLPVLENDLFQGKDDLKICDFTYPLNGILLKDGNELTYIPKNSFTGEDVFLYTICTSNGIKSSAQVKIRVERSNSPPIAIADRFEGQTTPLLLPVINNDYDSDSDGIRLEGFNQPVVGSIIRKGDQLIFNAPDNWSGQTSFRYQIVDEGGLGAEADVVIEIKRSKPIKLPPLAKDDVLFVNSMDRFKVCPLENDIHPEGEKLFLKDIGTTTLGKFTREGDCYFFRTILTQGKNTEMIPYFIEDKEGTMARAKISLVVDLPINQPPVALIDSIFSGGEAINIAVLDNDYDPEGDQIRIVTHSQPRNGKLSRNSYKFNYLPDPYFNGTDEFTYEITDATGKTSNTKVIIQVQQEDDLIPQKEIFINETLEGTSDNRLTFLVDISNSMDRKSRLPLLKKTLAELVLLLRSNDKISIVVFSENARVLIEGKSGADRRELLQVIRKMSPETKTNAEVGLKLAYQTAKKNFETRGNNKIIIATDGKFTKFDALKQIVIENDSKPRKVDLSIFYFNQKVDKIARNQLSKLAKLGGGNFSPVTLDTIASMVMKEIR